MPKLRVQPKLLVVHDDPAVVAEIAATLTDWWIGGVDHGDLAVIDAPHFDAVLVDLDREPVDGWFVLARLAPATAVVAVGRHRCAPRAFRLGAAAFATSFAAVAGMMTSESRLAS